jgi:hypothetical protein
MVKVVKSNHIPNFPLDNMVYNDFLNLVEDIIDDFLDYLGVGHCDYDVPLLDDSESYALEGAICDYRDDKKTITIFYNNKRYIYVRFTDSGVSMISLYNNFAKNSYADMLYNKLNNN